MDFIDILTNDDRIRLGSYYLEIRDCENFDGAIFKAMLGTKIRNIDEFYFYDSEGEVSLDLTDFTGLTESIKITECESLETIKLSNNLLSKFHIENCKSFGDLKYILRFITNKLFIDNCQSVEIFRDLNESFNEVTKNHTLKSLTIKNMDVDFDTLRETTLDLTRFSKLEELIITDSNLTDLKLNDEVIKRLKRVDLSGTPLYEKYGNDLVLIKYKGDEGFYSLEMSGLI